MSKAVQYPLVTMLKEDEVTWQTSVRLRRAGHADLLLVPFCEVFNDSEFVCFCSPSLSRNDLRSLTDSRSAEVAC